MSSSNVHPRCEKEVDCMAMAVQMNEEGMRICRVLNNFVFPAMFGVWVVRVCPLADGCPRISIHGFLLRYAFIGHH